MLKSRVFLDHVLLHVLRYCLSLKPELAASVHLDSQLAPGMPASPLVQWDLLQGVRAVFLFPAT